MTAEEQRQKEVNGAWGRLAKNPDFILAMQDAQQRYHIFEPSFSSKDGFNPHAAAQRDGHKEVLADFALRIARKGAEIPPPTQTEP